MSRLTRLATIMRTVGRYRLDEFIDTEALGALPRAGLAIATWRLRKAPDLPRGVRLRRALEELGPVFIKFGQMLSTRRDLLPTDIADELARLQDKVPPFPEQQSIAIIEKDLGKSVDELFASFEAKPMASASVAQVHAATLHSGEKVVVKVIRPDIEPIIRQDLALMFTLAKLVARYSPQGRRLRPCSWEAIRSVFKPVLEDPKVTIVGQNLKFDGKIMARHGVDLTQANLEDTMVAHYLLEPDQPHGMDALAQAFLGYQCIPITALIGKKGKNQKSMADLPPEDVVDYACEDADVTLRLADVLLPKLAEEGLDGLFRDIEMPLLSVLMHMEMEGVALDTNHLSQFSATLADQLDALQKSIQGHAGIPFNVDSPKQLGEVLFEHLDIPAKVKKTKTGQYPTSEAVLSKLKDKHPIVAEVLEYRKLKKLRSTYVEPLPALILEETGRVHTTYMQVVAATGRLSSKDPNLQNIPIRTEQGREIRKAFVPRDSDHVLVAADYSQVELRIAAAMSKEQGLIEAFQKGEDIHAATAAKVFGVALEDVTREQRSQAKAVNFGILYGQGAFGLAETLGISRKEAKSIIDAYHTQFSGLEAFTQTCVAKARESGMAKTLLGRRRPLADIHSNNAVVRAFAERNAVNTPIQGSAADIIKVAMIDVAKEMQGMKSRLIMQVHDELVVDAAVGELDDVKALLVRCMERAVKLEVPLEVDVSHGQNWLEAH